MGQFFSSQPDEQVSGGDVDPWRDSYKQQLYREQSSSKFKEDKEAAHKVSLEIAHFVDKKAGMKLNDAQMKRVMNEPYNFRMVSRNTNRSEHRTVDRSLMEKSESRETLTEKEKKRARGIKTVNEDHFKSQYLPLYQALNKHLLNKLDLD